MTACKAKGIFFMKQLETTSMPEVLIARDTASEKYKVCTAVPGMIAVLS